MQSHKVLLVTALCILAAGCQTTMLADDRIASDTAGVLGVSPGDVTISDRRSMGPTNTAYKARTRSGIVYNCVINGGGLLAMGMTNMPTCNPAPAR